MSDQPILELQGVSKTFGAVHALTKVDFRVHVGEVMALVGDNGAGKSTLIKGVAGIHPFDEGEILWEGSAVHIAGPKDAAKLGIEVVYQDLALCDNLDVVQNMYLGREALSSFRRLDETTMERKARETLKTLAVTTLQSVRQPVAVALRRPAPVGRGRQGRDVELQARHPRRADRGARRRADAPGPRPRQAARPAGPRASFSSPTTCTTSSRSPTASRCCGSARTSAS